MGLFIAVSQAFKNDLLVIFLFLVLFDFATGYLKALKWKVVSSDVGTKGVIKHTTTFIFYAMLMTGGYYFHAQIIANSVILMVMLTYITSILENLAVMGVYVPTFLKNRVEKELKEIEHKLNKGE